jgi:putative ABC transport system permease protein
MGASVEIIMRLLSREIFYLLGISAVISIPAYFGVKAWLQRFAYHIDFQLWIYFLILALVALLVLVLSMATVSYHAYRAATANPAESLRME